MTWEKTHNSFIFCAENENLESSNLDNLKISSTICSFNDLVDFMIDDIVNIYFNISTLLLSTTLTSSTDSMINLKLPNYIHNIKISISIRVEYKAASGIKTFTFSSYIGDFIMSAQSSCNFTLLPILVCLWQDSNNKYNSTLTYAIIEKE